MIGLLFLDHHWNLLFPVCQTRYGQNGDTPEQRHLKMATDCPDRNVVLVLVGLVLVLVLACPVLVNIGTI